MDAHQINPPPPRPLYAGQPRIHEVEDLEKLPRVVFSYSNDPDTWINLSKAILLNENLGKDLPDEFFDRGLMHDEHRVTTLAGRWQTFLAAAGVDWSDALEMAQHGLYINSDGRVCCFACDIMLREIALSPDVPIIQRHRQLAQNCVAHKHIPQGQRARRHSTSVISA